jgi:hypothetical protein
VAQEGPKTVKAKILKDPHLFASRKAPKVGDEIELLERDFKAYRATGVLAAVSGSKTPAKGDK